MIYLSEKESGEWKSLAQRIVSNGGNPMKVNGMIRPGLIPAFHYYTGTWLLSENMNSQGLDWIRAGMEGEQGALFSNAFLASYLGRNGGRLVIPEAIFSDPEPYIHFANTPVIADSRVQFRIHCVHTLPSFTKPLRIMDIGCGHGKILVDLLKELQQSGRIGAVGEILLIDPSEGMLRLARENAAAAFPEATIRVIHSRIEDFTEQMEGTYDIALASLAYHHMPYETKLLHLTRLGRHIDFFILYELDANNDTPELHSPELALSVYQSYGSLMDAIFAFDAPVQLALASIDRFLMSEAVYFFTQPRGKRSDYHMLRSQWHDVFIQGLGKEFNCLCDSLCYADENIGLFTMIYGK
ncbi:MAG: class I SAM-dependent methyltransferase [Bacteroidales bacterium]|nr:class I SAM-dependent methyltransferase [Bacteroidales bacterium]